MGKDVDYLKIVKKELVEKSNASEEDITELKADVEAARMNIHLTNKR